MTQKDATSSMPGVSIVIPAYNAETCVARAVNGALAQTAPPLEVLVVDDGSRDRTAEIVREFPAPVRYLHQANAGVSAARNRGIREARGEWIAFLDADDEWLPNKLAMQLALSLEHPDMAWCACRPTYMRAGAETPAEIPSELRDALRTSAIIPFFDGLRRGLFVQTSGFMIRKSVLEETGGFDESLRVNEDRDLWWRIAFRHPDIGYCPEVGYRFVLDQPASLTKQAHSRTPHAEALSRNLRRATAAGPDVLTAFQSYARKLAVDYLIRCAAREVVMAPEARTALLRDFPLNVNERVLHSVLRLLPGFLARRVVRRLSL